MNLDLLERGLCLATAINVALMMRLKRLSVHVLVTLALAAMFFAVGDHKTWIVVVGAAAITIVGLSPKLRETRTGTTPE